MFESLGVADWVIWYMISQYAGLAVFGFYMLYTTRFKIGFKAVFVRRASQVGKVVSASEGSESSGKEILNVGDYVVVGDKEFKNTAESVSFKDKTFVIDLAYAGYRKFGFTYFLFDLDKGSALRFGGEKQGVDSKLVDLFTNSGVIAQLVKGLRSVDKMLLVMVIVAVVAVGVGSGLGGYLLGQNSMAGNHTVVTGMVF